MRAIERATFLSAAGAAALSACAHRQATSIIPAVSGPSAARRAAGTPAAAIPDDVLKNPIIGEARRFDGATAPPGWIKAEGQTLPVAQYRQLFSILGKGGARDGASFILPAPPQGWIIAVAGVYPNSARALAALRRGRNVKLGVAVDGIDVREAPVRPAAVRPAAETVETWYPGTMPTAAEVAEQQRAEHEIFVGPQQHRRGAPHGG